jgi:hypothetical protein
VNTNKLFVEIKRPVGEVFTYAIDPRNTHKWISTIIVEETNEWPVGLGSEYANQNEEGKWSGYKVTAFKKNALFELTARDGNYHVRYTFIPLSDHSCTLDYYEWVDSGDLEDHSFLQSALQKLKSLLENS